METRFRNEGFSGSGVRDAATVMAYETFILGNTDILETLAKGVLKDHPIAKKLRATAVDLDPNEDNDPNEENLAYMREVLDAIEETTGVKVRYALWLADLDGEREIYARGEPEAVLDEYEIGPVVLSELDFDGTLYGYMECPKPIKEVNLS